MSREEWRAIQGYEGFYEVSNLGRVRSIKRQENHYRFSGRVLKPFVTGSNYLQVCLSKEGTAKNIAVHRLVATAFIPNPHGKETVNHINENKQDNRAENLEWLSLKENISYGTRAARQKKSVIESIGVPVYQIAPDGRFAIKEFETYTAAAEAVGATPSEIREAAMNGYRCRGFSWRKKDAVTENDLLFWKETGERVFSEISVPKTKTTAR